MEKLRVGNGIKKIEVNDDGEYIEIPISDTGFFERYAAILKFFEQKQKDIEKEFAEISLKYQSQSEDVEGVEEEKVNIDKAIEQISLYSNLCKDICEQLNNLFGADCCRKVFVGVENPGIELIGDFFEQITPILQKFSEERNNKINLKYNKHRKGANSK